MSGGDAISPELYPDVVQSTPFLLELFPIEVETKNWTLHTTLYDYMDEHQRKAWWGYIISAPLDLLEWIYGTVLIMMMSPRVTFWIRFI